MPLPTYSFGVSEFTTWPWTFEQDVERYSGLGVEAIEVCEFKLDGDVIHDQLTLIRASGLTISSVQPSTRTLFPSQSQPEPKHIEDRLDCFTETIDRFGETAQG